MRKTTTTYACDACGATAKTVRELQRFQLVRVRRGRAPSDVAATDLCASCESRLLAAVAELFVADLPVVHAMSREGTDDE